jgi:hypothetical protein
MQIATDQLKEERAETAKSLVVRVYQHWNASDGVRRGFEDKEDNHNRVEVKLSNGIGLSRTPG